MSDRTERILFVALFVALFFVAMLLVVAICADDDEPKYYSPYQMEKCNDR